MFLSDDFPGIDSCFYLQRQWGVTMITIALLCRVLLCFTLLNEWMGVNICDSQVSNNPKFPLQHKWDSWENGCAWHRPILLIAVYQVYRCKVISLSANSWASKMNYMYWSILSRKRISSCWNFASLLIICKRWSSVLAIFWRLWHVWLYPKT